MWTYDFVSEAVIRGDLASIWAVQTDVAGWPSWDPHETGARIDGPFAVGTSAWSKPRGGPAASWTLTEVEPGRSWASTCALPGGALWGRSTFEEVAPGAVRCRRQVRVTGPLTPLFRLWFGPRMRRDLDTTWRRLEARVAAGGTSLVGEG